MKNSRKKENQKWLSVYNPPDSRPSFFVLHLMVLLCMLQKPTSKLFLFLFFFLSSRFSTVPLFLAKLDTKKMKAESSLPSPNFDSFSPSFYEPPLPTPPIVLCRLFIAKAGKLHVGVQGQHGMLCAAGGLLVRGSETWTGIRKLLHSLHGERKETVGSLPLHGRERESEVDGDVKANVEACHHGERKNLEARKEVAWELDRSSKLRGKVWRYKLS